MSTVPETMVSASQGMETFGLSMITNLAAGIVKDKVLTHHEVTLVANSNAPIFTEFMIEFIQQLTVEKVEKKCHSRFFFTEFFFSRKLTTKREKDVYPLCPNLVEKFRQENKFVRLVSASKSKGKTGRHFIYLTGCLTLT